MLGLAAALGTLLASTTANAAILTNYTLLGDSGTLRTTTYAPSLATTNSTLSGLYGSPTITPVAAGWKLTFIPSSGFFAGANNFGGGKDSEISGKLDFTVTFDVPIQLTLNIYEDGLYRTTGIGAVTVFGGAVVTALDPSNEQKGNSALTAHFQSERLVDGV